MNRSKAAVVVSGIVAIIQMAIGILSALFGLVGGLSLMPFDGVDIFLILFFAGGGILLIISSIKRQRLIKRFKKYVTIISNSSNGSIANLARMTNTAEDLVFKNLQQMIDKKYFLKAYIDLNSGNLMFADQNQAVMRNAEGTPIQTNTQAGIEMLTVKCTGCGGVNRIAKGQVGECEYCGTVLKGQ